MTQAFINLNRVVFKAKPGRPLKYAHKAYAADSKFWGRYEQY